MTNAQIVPIEELECIPPAQSFIIQKPPLEKLKTELRQQLQGLDWARADPNNLKELSAHNGRVAYAYFAMGMDYDSECRVFLEASLNYRFVRSESKALYIDVCTRSGDFAAATNFIDVLRKDLMPPGAAKKIDESLCRLNIREGIEYELLKNQHKPALALYYGGQVLLEKSRDRPDHPRSYFVQQVVTQLALGSTKKARELFPIVEEQLNGNWLAQNLETALILAERKDRPAMLRFIRAAGL